MARDQSNDSFARASFLALLSGPLRARLLSLGVTAHRPAGHELIRQGDSGDVVFLLIDAIVKITAMAENGSEILLAVRVSGDVVGDMAVLNEAPRSATVTTCGPSAVCVIKGPVFLDFLRRSPEAGLALNRLISDRLRWANQRRLDFAGYEADIRLARLILALAERHGRRAAQGLDLGVPLTQAELGALIGAKEATVQKALRELADRKLIRRGRRGVLIVEPWELAKFAETPDTIERPRAR
ncbi:Crp/Fnr family transcriptional regulator [Planobispora longispora]|uniref:Crp/Fnr family transcriptional regulator n=1 Tax=Planobispora longispora TaxID=28887 RepID=A0A8J3W4J6_9ACTN|nr:Crp/Fnr family transcriptional regulator [Planobispora longispora]BFE81702.1 Crp/Fnr family transcriptional regulator [Planobispora longispora]GIH76504.1 Crp/Fnr family transcriptional regulator [Planobispora longispora]